MKEIMNTTDTYDVSLTVVGLRNLPLPVKYSRLKISLTKSVCDNKDIDKTNPLDKDED